MKPLVALLTVLTCGAAKLCVIKTAKDLDAADSCTSLILDGDDGVMQSPQLFGKTKMATTYEHLKLTNTKLARFSEAETVELPRGAVLEITDNVNLRKLPKFSIVDGTDVKLTVVGNPKLDTTQLLQECRAKGCSEENMNRIQMPYTCRPSSPLPQGCQALFGEVSLEKYDESWDEVKTVYGTLSLKNSKLERVPKLAKLAVVEQVGQKPVLIIENNTKLANMDSLLSVNYKIKNKKNAVVIRKNPELCIDAEYAAKPFVLEDFKEIKLCKDESLIHQSERKRVVRSDDAVTEDGTSTTVETTGSSKDTNTEETTSGSSTEVSGNSTDTNEAATMPESSVATPEAGNGTDHTTGDDEGAQRRVGAKPFDIDDDTSLGSSLVTNSCWIITLIYVLSLSLKNS